MRAQIGFLLGGERGLYYGLTGRENLRYFAVLYHLAPSKARSRVEELQELVGLRGRADERMAGYYPGIYLLLYCLNLYQSEIYMDSYAKPAGFTLA